MQTTKTALNYNKIEKIYEDSNLCFEQTKLKELKCQKGNNVYKMVKSERKMHFSLMGSLHK